ncbi:MAG: DNA mismatch repair protein MutL [Candidatus Binatia bacterium]|nr:MAG: DNA mismatch repair protein MutL [Candidatus Binatia bacterium]
MAAEEGREIRGVSPGRRIRVLPPEVSEKIAAGEVVERPASVVKELVENALDAGATSVVVEVSDAGVGRIAVTDDGAGMSPEDAVLAFRRHATSKIERAEDLFRVSSLGFRGEALAAIAAVSSVSLVTRPRESEAATRVRVRGGKILEVSECGSAPGTRIDVEDLFFNTPARRKFLRSPGAETGAVQDLLQRFALAYPAVAFSLRQEGGKAFHYPSAPSPEERVAQVLGRERFSGLLPVEARSASSRLRGWISLPGVHFPTSRNVSLFVNGRPVRDRTVLHALSSAYGSLLPAGRFPMAVLFLDVPPEDVDVNVHPTKAEVRFRRSGLVHDLVGSSVRSALGRISGPRPRPQAVEWRVEARTAPPTAARDGGAGGIPGDDARLPFVSDPPRPLAPAREASGSTGFFSSLRVVGQIFQGYLVCQSSDSLVLVDQHAAHERVVFDRLKNAYAGRAERQVLLVPRMLELRGRDIEALEAVRGELERVGFEIEPFGTGTFLVRAVPALLGEVDPGRLLTELAEEVAGKGGSRRPEADTEQVLAGLACHSAVRVGESLDEPKMRALLEALDGVPFSGHCPHGRPVFLEFSRPELERRFGRRG